MLHRHVLLMDGQRAGERPGDEEPVTAAAAWAQPGIRPTQDDIEPESGAEQPSQPGSPQGVHEDHTDTDAERAEDTHHTAAGHHIHHHGHHHTYESTDAGTSDAASSGLAGTRAVMRRVRTVTPAASKHVAQTWLRIDQLGNTGLVTSDKQKVAIKLGVQPRDLRLLDPAMASVSPPAILDRERAIVVNLGAVKCIITLEYVLVVNPEDEMAAALINTLKDKLSNPIHVGKVMSYPGLSRISSVSTRLQFGNATGAVVGLSFELKVLEICLDIAVEALDHEAKELEHIIVPTLDNLTRRVKTQELEVLRRSKNRLTRLVKRIETVKEVLEKFLQDDEDMHKLNLTAQEITRQATIAELNMPEGAFTPRSLSRNVSRRASNRRVSSNNSSSSGSSRSAAPNYEDEAEVAEVEMLLEAYQMHLDHMYNKLQTLEQFVEDAEDLVNVSLDTHRNRIIAVDIVLTAFVTALGIGTAVSGLFGMNMEFHDLVENTPRTFKLVATLGSVGLPLLVMGTFVGWAIWTRAINFSG